jgi:acyl-CoA thioesterase
MSLATPSEIDLIYQHIANDPHAAQLGALLEELTPGYARYSLVIEPSLVNFHGIAHGGVIFTLADLAFAAASNSHGLVCVAQTVTITFIRASHVGARLIAEANEIAVNGPLGCYELTVHEAGSGVLIARCQAVAYRKKEKLVLA